MAKKATKSRNKAKRAAKRVRTKAPKRELSVRELRARAKAKRERAAKLEREARTLEARAETKALKAKTLKIRRRTRPAKTTRPPIVRAARLNGAWGALTH
ncbi:MAG: hypothetical protein ACREH4_06450 [Vitreimonas sp.]